MEVLQRVEAFILAAFTPFPYFQIGIAPTVPGLEYSAAINRLHYAGEGRLHWAADVNRLHYEARD